MRGCEFLATGRPGRTTPLELRDVTFRDTRKRVIDQTDPDLIRRAEFVTVRFRDQKNGKRMDLRTHSKSGDKRLCPVTIWGDICKRVRRFGGTERSKVFTLTRDDRTIDITLGRVVRLLKNVGKTISRNHPEVNIGKIGSRSIRSGAAMALFKRDHHPERIKILGRWSSDAFLVYIRPQVLEWTNLMAKDMAREPSKHGFPVTDEARAMPRFF